jgi:hypothetical protein
MRRLSTFVIFFLLTSTVFCQEVNSDTVFNPDQRLLKPKKFNYHLTLGSEFTSASGFGSALNTYVTPSFSYNLSKRFSIGGGISVIQTNYFNARPLYQDGQSSSTSGNFTSGMIFVSGQYLVSDRLTIYGSAYKQFPITKDPLPYNPFNPVSSRGAQGVDFNVGYRIGDNVYIQAGFHYSDGQNPYYNDPFNNNPFMNNSYGRQCGFGIPRW